MQNGNMGKQRPKDTRNSTSETKTMFKPPIHRITANSIAKNMPIQRELFKLAVPVATARMQPNLIGDFVRKHAKEYYLASLNTDEVMCGVHGRLNLSSMRDLRNSSFWIPKFSWRVPLLHYS